MANAKKVGTLIKKARTAAGLTQEQLSRKVKGANASDIGRAERGEKELTTEQLKQVAKATGVTQKSLLDAAKGTSSKPASTASKPASNANTTSMKVTATERKLVEAYRKADSQTKKNALKLLKGGGNEVLAGNLLSGVLNSLTGKRSVDEEGEESEEE
ncbi:MAG: helix-turn-helix transcriptional regulator [Clostridia bacterium]|nr:helix-turn-helix transcriptional regulator [Clostridia bacterium]